MTRLASRAVIARVLNWVPSYETHEEAGAGEHPREQQPSRRAQRRAAAVKAKIEFGRGTGRCAGFYRQYAKVSDPDCEEAREARKEARARARAEAQRAEQAARDSQQRDANAHHHEQEHAREEARRESARQEGHMRHEKAQKGVDFDLMRCTSWDEYNARFLAFRERALAAQSFHVKEIPLPPKGQVIGPTASPEDWHKALQKAQLRWHPDKWSRLESMLEEHDERDQLKQLTQGMFRAVARAKDRGFGHVRFPARSAAMWAED